MAIGQVVIYIYIAAIFFRQDLFALIVVLYFSIKIFYTQMLILDKFEKFK